MRAKVQGLLVAAYLFLACFADGIQDSGMAGYTALVLAVLIGLLITAILPEHKRTPAGSRPRRGRQRVNLSWDVNTIPQNIVVVKGDDPWERDRV